jgi:protein-S-isoprenylcysteine O-methyltransferase Ste14
MSITYTQPLLFILFSTLMAYYARDWFRQHQLHGLTRFLALEFFLALTLLSVPSWLLDPLSSIQILSWSLLLASLVLAMLGYRLLTRYGKPENTLEVNHPMALIGFYRYIRHPLYTSLILFSIGVFLKAVTLLNTLLVLFGIAFLYWTAREEEMENLDRFGVEYAQYLDTSKMFVPFVF